MKYVCYGTVTAVRERAAQHYVAGTGHGDKAQFESESLGWFVTLDSYHSFYVGEQRPVFAKGDEIKITLEKV